MAEPQSDADKIRNKRLAKLGGSNAASPTSVSGEASQSSGTDRSPAPTSAQSNPAENTKPSNLATASQHNARTEAQPSAPNVTIAPLKSSSPKRASTSPDTRPKTRPSAPSAQEAYDRWENKTILDIFRATLNSQDIQDHHGKPLWFVPGVVAELEQQPVKDTMRVNVDMLDQIAIEVGQQVPGNPLGYFIACVKRASRYHRDLRSVRNSSEQKLGMLKSVRTNLLGQCIIALTSPDIFGVDMDVDQNELAKYFLVDPDKEDGIDHDFLQLFVEQFSQDEDDPAKLALVEAIEYLSGDLSKKTMNDDYKPYMRALNYCSRYKPVMEALAKSDLWLPDDLTGPEVESRTLLGPFFSLSPVHPQVASNYFNASVGRDRGHISNSQNATRMTLQTHQDELFDITNCFIKGGKATRDRMLDWFATCINLNHKRSGQWRDDKTIASDGFMISLTIMLDRLCEPFMDASFSKIDRIDIDYFRRSPRVGIKDETKINADQKTSDEFWNHQMEGESNFITEIFFLTVAAHHYGTEAASNHITELGKSLKHLEKQIESLELERSKYSSNPIILARYEAALKKYKEKLEQGHSVMYATQGILLDTTAQTRSMQFMRYVIVWLLRVVSGKNFPKQKLDLPLPQEQPDAFKCLPEYLLEDIVGNFKFIVRNMPGILTSTQCDELIMICITFLRSSEYVKNPYVKSGLVTILTYGVYPQWNRSKGILGDQLNASPFALSHLLHALMKFYIEAESTGTHTQFYDKFNIRYEIFQIIRCIWSNPVYRQNLDTEAKVNIDFFVRFVNLLLNDVTFVLDESFTAFMNIHDITKELNTSGSLLDDNQRQGKEEALAAAKSKAKSYMDLTNETVSMLKLFTESLADAFTMPEVVQRLADMLDYNLDTLVGPKQSQLRVDNAAEYHFDPKKLLSELVDVYLNLGEKSPFQFAVARDGRSYKPSNFDKASSILTRFGLKSKVELDNWNTLGKNIANAKAEDDQAEEDLGEVPDEFLDPLMATIMEDPVILPASKTTIDRSTIRSHLLSDPSDPFNRTPLKIEDVIPDVEMKKRIDNFKQEKKDARAAEKAAVKGE